MKMKINQVAKLTGVTIRTLHYYDEINLLSPNQVTEAGYRPLADSGSVNNAVRHFRNSD